jgi:hypothetical protein
MSSFNGYEQVLDIYQFRAIILLGWLFLSATVANNLGRGYQPNTSAGKLRFNLKVAEVQVAPKSPLTSISFGNVQLVKPRLSGVYVCNTIIGPRVKHVSR